MTLSSYKIPAKDQEVSIYVEENLLSSDILNKCIERFSKNILIVTDTNVLKLYGETLHKRLTSFGLNTEIFSISPGEASKSRKIKHEIEDFMLKKGFLRKSLIIALGGGVVMDLAGFVASTYMRSIPLITLPTTLLGAVDAAVGGKTAINTQHGKNLIGSVYHPKVIFVDTKAIKSCPDSELTNGLAEVIKYGLIDKASLIEKLEKSISLWKTKEPNFLKEIIEICQNEKIKVIQKDVEEHSYRKILNFGHSIGHAIEQSCNFEISHGEAISIGMIVESYLSFKQGYLNEADLNRVIAIFKTFDFPLELPKNLNKQAFLKAILFDKKNSEEGVGIVMLSKIGKVKSQKDTYIEFFSIKVVEMLFDWMQKTFNVKKDP